VVFEPIGFYFCFDHSDVRIKQFVSFRYRNEFKIKLQKQIGFMHVDITSQEPLDISTNLAPTARYSYAAI
jgi:hypothetical protein